MATSIPSFHLEQVPLNLYIENSHTYNFQSTNADLFCLTYTTDVSYLLRKIEDLTDYINKRNYGIERCLQEHKYLFSETAGKDIGIESTIQSFRTIFPGFDDGFLLAYMIPEKEIPLIYDQRKSCSWFIKRQGEELKTFFERLMIEMMAEQGSGITFKEAEKRAVDRYCEGFRAGFRSHFCGKKCKFPRNCELRDLYK